MKKLIIYYSILIFAVLYSACAKSDIESIAKDNIVIGTGNAPGEFLNEEAKAEGEMVVGPYSCLTIVRFNKAGQDKKVILQHPIMRYDTEDGCYEYYEDKGISLNVLPEQCDEYNGSGLNLFLVKWVNERMNILGTSPYIPLSHHWYLVDWKWHQLLPLSAIAETSSPFAYYDNFAEHINNHVYITDLDWNDINDLTSTYEMSSTSHHINEIEIIRVWTLELACYFGDVESDPYGCWNNSIYYNHGMCYDNAFLYDMYGDCSATGKTTDTYIQFCDSMQSVYQQQLIEIINNGKIKEIGF